MRWLVLCLVFAATPPPPPAVNPDMPSYDPVTGLPAPYDTGVAGKVAARLAFRRAQKVYQRLPPWMQRTSPEVRMNRNVGTGAIGLTNWGDEVSGRNGYAKPAHPRVNLGVEVTRDLAGARGLAAQKRAQTDLIHEIGHTEGLGEGQAETVARHLGLRLFGSDTTGQGAGTYEPQVEALAQKHPNTMQYIRRRQIQQRPDSNAGRLLRQDVPRHLKRLAVKRQNRA